MSGAIAAALLLAGCALGPRPVPLSPEPPELKIAPAFHVPLRAAVVVADPHGHRLMQESSVAGDPPREVTEESGGEVGLPLGRALGALSLRTFAQVFDKAELFARPPEGPAHDVAILVQVTEVSLRPEAGRSLAPLGAPQTPRVSWRLTVQDPDGIDILHKSGSLAGRPFASPAGVSRKAAAARSAAMGASLSALLSELARRWGELLLGSEELRQYAESNPPM